MTTHRYLRYGLCAAAIVAAAALAPAAAYAQPEAGAIAFSGGCATDQGVTAQQVIAEPDRLNLARGAEVRLVNRLSREATVQVDGQDAVRLPVDGFVVLRIHDGPVEVALRISCPDGPVTGVARVGVVDGVATTTMPPDLLSRQLAQQGAGPSSEQPAPDAGGEGADDPAAGDDAGAGSSAGDDEPSGDAPEQAADRPAAVADPTAGGPNGVLALVAAACVAGVSAGAIRAIRARRETQA